MKRQPYGGSARPAQNHQLVQSHSQALPVRVLQATESWAGPGNEATAGALAGHNAKDVYELP